MVVIKRDGRKVEFDKSKIVDAIAKAFKSCEYETIPYHSIMKIASEIEGVKRAKLTVEEIQDIVEKKLMSSTYKDVAKAYITHRNLRTMARNQYKEMMDAIGEKLAAKDVQNQNANVDEKSFGGRIGEASRVVTKQYALDYCMSEMAKNNHLNNEIYIHDLDSYAVGLHNCLSVPFDDLLANGFNTRQTDVRPAQSVSTALQLVAVIFQIQSLQQFGGVSATHLDWTLVPYVRKSFWKHFRDGIIYCEEDGNNSEIFTMKNSDKDRSITDEFWTKGYPKAYKYAMDMTERECRQAVEGMYHNLK